MGRWRARLSLTSKGAELTAFSHDQYCDEVVVQAGLLEELLRDVGLSQSVPTCPGWTLKDLKEHVIEGIWSRWKQRRAANRRPTSRPPFRTPPRRLLETLRTARPNQTAEFAGITLPAAFWVRRATRPRHPPGGRCVRH